MCSESVVRYAAKRGKSTRREPASWTTTSEFDGLLVMQRKNIPFAARGTPLDGGEIELAARRAANSATGSTPESADDCSRSGSHKPGHCRDERSPLLRSAAAYRLACSLQSSE